jgi:serine/threonine protein kinase
MRVVVNPKYENLRPFVEGILSRSYKVDKIYRNFRNIVEDTTVGGVRVVVKIFKKPTEVNRVVYSFLRPTKAKRSYYYSLRLISSGIDVPEPIGYVEKRKGLFFHTGCYVCLYTDYRSIADFKDYDLSSEEAKKRFDTFVTEFALYVADFHSKGFVHNDFNIDNILYKEVDGHFLFQLIDLNRVRFNNRSLQKCAKDISYIHFDAPLKDKIIELYCRARDLDTAKFSAMVASSRNKSKTVSKIKDIVLTPLGLRKKRPKNGIVE